VTEEQYCQIDDLVQKNIVDQPALQDWQRTLNALAVPLELRLCLTGEALDPASQQQIARALFENIPRGNDIVFDISHGFRHQPVIATFLVSLMRWTHQIRSVRLFSGVFEARQGEVTPVLEMPICQELVNATEAAATLALTGNFEPVARCLGRDAELAWFLENTNQVAIARRRAQDLQIDNHRDMPMLSNHNSRNCFTNAWNGQQGDRFADRVLESARTALEANDYFRAIVLGYEALLIRAGQILYPNADPLSYQSRLDAEKALFARLTEG
jgi:CRISPR-associated DxTHG motif protein